MGRAHLGGWVLLEARVEDSIADLVGKLVGVSLVHGLGGKEKVGLFRHSCSACAAGAAALVRFVCSVVGSRLSTPVARLLC